MKRADIQANFVAQFGTEKASPSSPAVLTQVETELKTLLPESFIEFATRYGAVHTPAILDLVTGGESEIAPEGSSFDVQNFLSADDILKTTHVYRTGGMDESLVVIASDCMGNVFGFRAVEGTQRPDDATVYVFDHDFAEVSEEAASFDLWLKSFLDMKK
jgi:hypothetical protein